MERKRLAGFGTSNKVFTSYLFKYLFYLQRTFAQWIQGCLIPFRNSLNKAERRILLLLDGHATHTHGPNIELCRANNIDVCFLPPHTSHILQPLDIGVFGSYKAAFRRSATDGALEIGRAHV